MTSTTDTASTTSPPDPFAEADLTWELERLYQDLAAVKGQPLRDTEKRYLRGLLCGYGPEELAKKVYRQPKSLTSYLSRTLYQYIKDLTGHEKMQSHGQLSSWLEKYKRPRAIHSSLKYRPEGSLPMEGVFHIEHGYFYFDVLNNVLKGDVHIHFEAPLPEKQKGGGEG